MDINASIDSSHPDNSFSIRNGSSTEAQKLLETFWEREMESVYNVTPNDFRTQELPLARIKKIMKLDEDVKMISGEAPVLFARAVEMFISELSLRAWVNTEDNKRRTLQRNDIAMAISKFDQFDFLIDIVPREEAKPMKRNDNPNSNVITQDQLNYFFQIAQQQQQQPIQAGTGQPIQILQSQSQGQPFAISPQVFQVPVAGSSSTHNQEIQPSPVVQINHSSDPNSTPSEKSNLAAPIIMSNVYNNGEIVQQIPITLSSQQYQTILQNQNSRQNQPIIINPQSLSVPAQYNVVTNTGQVVQAIIPTPTNLEHMAANKIVSINDENDS